MQFVEWLVFEKLPDGSYPERTNNVISASSTAFDDVENIIAIKWQPVDGDRNAMHYKRISDKQAVYEPIQYSKPDYVSLRLHEYGLIPFGDQLDAILKFALAQGLQPDINKGQDTPEGLAARILAIKAKHPKPEAE